ncbi:5'-nucleotidase C-terminal domain-containing protein [Flavobacterium sp. D11R37]|uniref:5'-nucleotidase C-terminal domain-containing protein n=1 Tax=Flavobacterium coralii TaxID=2838017 RepID=UPI001CA78AD4|nr:5'-nucleotidase [Flavobacterium coralii]MBY8961232.1 5'-nucleotidase C-terminal domain-containing protein [Flavobacterium coralii]
MINLKKNNAAYYMFVLFLTLFAFISCGPKKFYSNRVDGKKIPVTEQYAPDSQIENFIAPYREHIDNDLDSVLAWSPVTFDKSKGKWQTNIGNLMADVTFEKADKIFYIREKKHVDICLLNHGGIRATIPQGFVTARTAYEIMPFENSLIIMALKGQQIWEIAAYIANERKPHPLAGMQIVMDKDNSVKRVTVQGQPVDNSRIYYVATSDYLSNGGDHMDFFKKATASYDMDYKLRNLYIDYFKEVDTLPVNTSERIIIEQ